MTLAAITMTAPEAASPVQMYRATYSPDDNKLRLYAASRLDPETYKKVHDAGFRWAPKQALFVAPAWTPGREDVLLSLAGEIEDEDSTLAERQEARAERFTGYSGKRASESAQALDEVERLAAMIPPGQPILVGHHSERRARRDAQRIENGMKRAVMLFERAEYWEERARSALLHAKYKERPDVRWRRIKKIEADLRKAEKTIAQSQKYLTMWRAESLDLNMANSSAVMTISAPVSRWTGIRARQKKASMKGAGRYGRPWMMTSSPRSRPAKLRSAIMNGRFSISNAGLTTIRTA